MKFGLSGTAVHVNVSQLFLKPIKIILKIVKIAGIVIEIIEEIIFPWIFVKIGVGILELVFLLVFTVVVLFIVVLIRGITRCLPIRPRSFKDADFSFQVLTRNFFRPFLGQPRGSDLCRFPSSDAGQFRSKCDRITCIHNCRTSSFLESISYNSGPGYLKGSVRSTYG